MGMQYLVVLLSGIYTDQSTHLLHLSSQLRSHSTTDEKRFRADNRYPGSSISCSASGTSTCGTAGVPAVGVAPKETEVQETLASENFQICKTVRHGFPYQPTALAFDPVQKIVAIGTRTGGVRMYPFT
ncbi:UNVERIFIED_CONTAM: hypothetical protein FKN15_077105 [Acipenser sinensis]